MSEIEDKDELLLKDHNFNRRKKGTPVEYIYLSPICTWQNKPEKDQFYQTKKA